MISHRVGGPTGCAPDASRPSLGRPLASRGYQGLPNGCVLACRRTVSPGQFLPFVSDWLEAVYPPTPSPLAKPRQKLLRPGVSCGPTCRTQTHPRSSLRDQPRGARRTSPRNGLSFWAASKRGGFEPGMTVSQSLRGAQFQRCTGPSKEPAFRNSSIARAALPGTPSDIRHMSLDLVSSLALCGRTIKGTACFERTGRALCVPFWSVRTRFDVSAVRAEGSADMASFVKWGRLRAHSFPLRRRSDG
jgi:hypothetical protein